MCKESFVKKITEEMEKRLGEKFTVKVQKVKKNNNVEYHGLIIQKQENNIAPTIYLDSFYEYYKQGETIDGIVEQIEEHYHRGEVTTPIDMDFFRDFEQVKGRIAYKLINAERNQELLEKIPHILFMDLAICFYYAFYNEQLGDGMILIYNTHMEMWKTNHRELMQLAQENTPDLFPAMFAGMSTLFREMCKEDMGVPPLYILTNQQKCQGASAILYPHMLEKIADELKSNYYILPSSVHEVILLKEDEVREADALHDMIVEANNTQVLAEEILSDYPYYYDCSTKKLTQVKQSD